MYVRTYVRIVRIRMPIHTYVRTYVVRTHAFAGVLGISYVASGVFRLRPDLLHIYVANTEVVVPGKRKDGSGKIGPKTWEDSGSCRGTYVRIGSMEHGTYVGTSESVHNIVCVGFRFELVVSAAPRGRKGCTKRRGKGREHGRPNA